VAPTRRSFLALGVAASTLRLHAASGDEPAARAFLDVPNAYRMRMHWFIFGPAWTAEECERELQLMAAAHIGGVLIFPAYPIALDDPAHGIRNQTYPSPEFFEVLNAALMTCKKLRLTADLLVGTGWPYGGLSVSPADSAKCLRRASVPVTAQAAVILTPAEVLNVELDGGMIDHLANHAGAFDQRLANLRVGIGLIEKHAVEFKAGPNVCLAKVDFHHVPFLHPVLPGAVFKNRVHDLPLRWLSFVLL